MSEIFSVDVEGGDQVGKGDAVKNLAERIAYEGYDVSVISFPCYATPIGNAVREVLKENIFSELGLDEHEAVSAKMALFALNRLEVLNYVLQKNTDTVYVCDRGPFSNALTIAYALVSDPVLHGMQNALVEEALELDSFFRYSMRTDNCVIKLSSGSSIWSKEREDGDLHERKDVQELSEDIYGSIWKAGNIDFANVLTKKDGKWRPRSEIQCDCFNFVQPKLKPNPKSDSMVPNYLEVGKVMSTLYQGGRSSSGALKYFSSSIMENNKVAMYESACVIARDVVNSVKDIRWYNMGIRSAAREILAMHDGILLLLERLYGERFVLKLLKSVQND
jgi:hypothetical protein